MSTPEHSPLPWAAFNEIEDGLVIYDANGLIVHLSDHYKMIVRAVNSHAKLLAAAKAMADHWTLENCKALEAAIAEAEQA